MPTSGQIGATMTAHQIITMAARRGLVLRAGQVADATLTDDGLALLSRMLKTWTMAGANLWRDGELPPVSCVAGQAIYTIAPRPMQVRNVRLAQSGVELRPLARWGRDDYDIMPNKAAAGAPTCFVVDRQRDATRLILWPVPNSTALSLLVGVERVIEDVTNAAEEIDAPQEWFDAVIDNLAVRLADEEGIDADRIASVRQSAAALYDLAQGHDRDGPVRFEVYGG